MVEIGPLKATAILDLAKNWNANISKLNSDLVDSETRGKELNIVWDKMGDAVGVIGTLGKVAGASILGFMTGAIAMSPQLKEMWMRLKPIMFDLGNYLGEKLMPIFDGIVEVAQKFVNSFIEMDQKYGVLDSIAKAGQGVLDVISQLPPDIMIGIGLGAVTLTSLTVLAALAKTLGILGLTTGAGGLIIPLALAMFLIPPGIKLFKEVEDAVTKLRQIMEAKPEDFEKLSTAGKILAGGIYVATHPDYNPSIYSPPSQILVQVLNGEGTELDKTVSKMN